VIKTISLWRLDINIPIMEEALKWLQHVVDVLEEGEESKEGVPIPIETYLEENIESRLQPPSPQRQVSR
jgi:hypothetical protein